MLAHARGLLELSYLIEAMSRLAQSKGAFHSTKNSGLNFRNFRISNGTVFSTRLVRSRSIPAWAHFSPRITRENAEGSWWSGCLECRKLLHVEKFKTHSEFNSSLISMREVGEYASRANWPTGNSELPVHNFPGNQIPRAGSICGRSFCIQWSVDSKDSPPSCSFARLKELGVTQIS